MTAELTIRGTMLPFVIPALRTRFAPIVRSNIAGILSFE